MPSSTIIDKTQPEGGDITLLVVDLVHTKPVFKMIRKTAIYERGPPTEVSEFTPNEGPIWQTEIKAKFQQIFAMHQPEDSEFWARCKVSSQTAKLYQSRVNQLMHRDEQPTDHKAPVAHHKQKETEEDVREHVAHETESLPSQSLSDKSEHEDEDDEEVDIKK